MLAEPTEISSGTATLLEYDPTASLGKSDAGNLIIAGDNLVALKWLLEDYTTAIRMIYIDPPYNTGKRFTFRDNFITASDGKSSSAEAGSHDVWWNFIFSRLHASRELLAEDGVIFVSIDDNEVHNLRRMMDQIFGGSNFVATMIRQSGIAPRQDARFIAVQHDYVVCYAKDSKKMKLNRKPSELKGFVHEDEYADVRGRYRLNKLDRGSIRYSESLDYPIEAPDGTEVWPGGNPEDKKWTWRWSKNKVEWGRENGFIVFKKSRDGKNSVYFKEYEHVDNKAQPRIRTNPYPSIIRGAPNEKGNRELNALFKSRVFDYPKPVALLKILLKMATDKNSVVLDFFAGAGSTGHAVWELNNEDGGSRKFILVQIDEPVQEENIALDFPTVADICIERVRRAAALFDPSQKGGHQDLGFRVYRALARQSA